MDCFALARNDELWGDAKNRALSAVIASEVIASEVIASEVIARSETTKQSILLLRRENWFAGARNDEQDSHPALQRISDFVQHLGVFDGRGHRPRFAIGDLLDGAAQDFPGARLRQASDGDGELERRNRSELFAH